MTNTIKYGFGLRYLFRKAGLYLTLAAVFGFLPEIARPDAAKLLDSDVDALAARFVVAETTHNELNLAYFIYKEDTTGNVLLAQMRAAKRRGVKHVRLLVDDMYNRLSPEMMAYLMSEGIEVKVYHPVGIMSPKRFFRRMHHKLFQGDDKMVTGGRNSENSFFTDRKIKRNRFLDLDIFFEGDVTSDARNGFMELWNSDHVSLPDVKSVSPELLRKKERVLDHYDKIVALYREKRGKEAFEMIGRKVPFLNPKLFMDNPSLKGTVAGSEAGILEVINGAEREIIIESPYVIFTDEIREALRAAIGRGVKVKLITNSPESNDIRHAGYRYAAERESMSQMGIEIHEYFPRPGAKGTIHGKVLVADGKKVAIGTYNLDPRSRFLNVEMVVTGESEAIGEELGTRWARIHQTTRVYNIDFVRSQPFTKRCLNSFYQALSLLVRSQL